MINNTKFGTYTDVFSDLLALLKTCILWVTCVLSSVSTGHRSHLNVFLCGSNFIVWRGELFRHIYLGQNIFHQFSQVNAEQLLWWFIGACGALKRPEFVAIVPFSGIVNKPCADDEGLVRVSLRDWKLTVSWLERKCAYHLCVRLLIKWSLIMEFTGCWEAQQQIIINNCHLST